MPYISLLVQSSLPGPPPRRLAVLSTPCRPIGPSHRPVHHLARRLARRLALRLARFALSLYSLLVIALELSTCPSCPRSSRPPCPARPCSSRSRLPTCPTPYRSVAPPHSVSQSRPSHSHLGARASVRIESSCVVRARAITQIQSDAYSAAYIHLSWPVEGCAERRGPMR